MQDKSMSTMQKPLQYRIEVWIKIKLLVQRICAILKGNRARYDKSMKLGTLILWIMGNILKIIGNMDMTFDGGQGHFQNGRQRESLVLQNDAQLLTGKMNKYI